MSPFETMGAVRQRCADFFGLDLNEFHLKVLNKLVDPDEDDDQYVRDHGMSQTIHCVHNPLYKKTEHPKFLLAQNKAHFALLFFLLSPHASGSSKLVEPVWELLQKLPVNKELLEAIKKLEGVQENGWSSLLDSASTSKLMYSLKIIEGLDDSALAGLGATSDDASPLAEWKQRFVSLGGFRHLLDSFTKLASEEIDSKLTLRCVESMVAALDDFSTVGDEDEDENGMPKPESCQGYILQHKEQVVKTCVRYIHLIGKLSLRLEEERGESYEDL